MKNPLSYLLIVGLALSCNTHETASEIKNSSPVSFKDFVKKFPIRPLPISIQYCKDDLIVDGLEKMTDADSIFVGAIPQSYCWGMLPDTSEYYYLIWTAPADNIIPVLGIFEKNGKKLKEESIIMGRCDCGGPCYTCKDYLEIRSDYSILAVDTFWTQECDSLYNVIDSTKTEVGLIYKTGKIHNGNVDMSEDIRKNFQF